LSPTKFGVIMKNFLLLFALCYLLVTLGSCKYPAETTSPETPPVQEAPVEVSVPAEEVPHTGSTPIGPEYPVQDVKKVFTVKIEDTNYTPEQKQKLAAARELIARIFNSEDFKKALESRKYTSTTLTGPEIYTKLFAGAEALQPAVNYQMDLKVTMYYKRFSKVVGYTYPDTLVVYTHSKYHNVYTACEVASNLTHEWSHKMGFDHSSAEDDNSVPYSLNTIIETLCPKFM
jgi:hypothetical protein